MSLAWWMERVFQSRSPPISGLEHFAETPMVYITISWQQGKLAVITRLVQTLTSNPILKETGQASIA